MSVQLKRACEMLAEAELTASGRSLSPELPFGARASVNAGQSLIQLSLPFG
jgi:hypothetical protein